MKYRIVILSVLIFILILPSLAKSQSHQDSTKYNQLIKDADALFKEKNYYDAVSKYRESLNLFPTSPIPKVKIAECEKNMQQQKYLEEIDKKYSAIIKKADKAFVAEDINLAKSIFTEALSLRPGDPYATQRIQECHIWIKDKMLAAQYKKLLEYAFEKMEQSDFVGAKDAFQKALSLKPESSFCKDNIDLIEAELKPQHEIEQKQKIFINKGDSCLMTMDTINATIYYQKAFRLKENCSLVKIISLLKREFVCCVEAFPPYNVEYLCALNKGEFYYKLKKYTEAMVCYEDALKIMPNELYPKDQIKNCRIRLKAISD